MLTIEEIKKFIDEDKTSKRKKQAEIGTRYYEHENDIKDYRIFFYNKDGELKEECKTLIKNMKFKFLVVNISAIMDCKINKSMINK